MNTIIGQILLNQFRVDAFVASGGMGAVYKVWDMRRNVSLAMKMLHAELAEDPSIFKRFEREARALQRLAHPNIVPFYGLYKTDDFAFLLEQYVDGPTLKHVLRQQYGKPLTIEQTLIYLKALSAALGYAHNNGVVHCDVKPGNVMVDRGGTIYLTDFGIARHAESTTTTLSAAGTAAYMAPEQCRAEPVTAQTDVYALGVIIYEMLTGSRPFQGDERGAESSGATAGERIRYAHVHLKPPDPRQFNPALSTALADALLKALAKEPAARYRDARALYEAVCAAAQADPDMVPDRAVLAAGLFGAVQATQGKPVQEIYEPPAPIVQPVSSTQRNRRQAGILLAGALALVVIAGVTVAALSGGTSRTPTSAPPSNPPASVPAAVPMTQRATLEQPTSAVTIAPTPLPPEPTLAPPATAAPPTIVVPQLIANDQSLGRSAGGRDISMLEVGNPDGPVVVVVGSIEGDQADTSGVVQQLMDWYRSRPDQIPNRGQLYLIPSICPDGNLGGSRFNANGVDLNRNWGSGNWTSNAIVPGYPKGKAGSGGAYPFSEPETSALRDLLNRLRSSGRNVYLITLHSTVNAGMRDQVFPGYTSTGIHDESKAVAERVAQALGYRYNTAWSYDTTGEAIAWAAEQGIPAIDIVSLKNSGASRSAMINVLQEIFR
jgi:serine/threonine-protein kinase